MTKFIVALYDSPHAAKTCLSELNLTQQTTCKDAVGVIKDRDGSLSLTQTRDQLFDPVLIGTALGAVAGILLGYLLWKAAFGFLIGAAFGAAFGALWGGLVDYGIDDDLIQRLSTSLAPESSALFLLFDAPLPDKIYEILTKTGATVIHTPLRERWEEALRKKLKHIKDNAPDQDLPVYEVRFEKKTGKAKTTHIENMKQRDSDDDTTRTKKI